MTAPVTYEDVKHMDVADLYGLNKSIVELIRVKNKERELRASSTFSAGDVLRFDSKKAGRIVHFTVSDVLPKSVHGFEMKEDGSSGTVKWKVSPSLCVKTTRADAMDSMKPKTVYAPPGGFLSGSMEEDDEDDDGASPVMEAVAEPAPPSDPARDRPAGEADAW